MDSKTNDAISAGFKKAFRDLQGDHPPFPWQERLFQSCFLKGELPAALDLPTGLGKTSVMAIWYLALKEGAKLPRRLVYVVDRRAVVDQATTVAENIKQNAEDDKLRISTLRGAYVDRGDWLEDPAAPAIIVGTVDMIGSRLLFSGYGVSRGMRPYHAGLLGADTLVVLDEAHLVPPFEALLRAIEQDREGSNSQFNAVSKEDRCLIPRFHLMSLSATGSTDTETEAGNVFRLTDEDYRNETVRRRLKAEKRLVLHEIKEAKALPGELAKRAWRLATESDPARMLVYCHSREEALKVSEDIDKRAKKEKVHAPSELLVGERRVHEREKLFGWLARNGFVEKPKRMDDAQEGPQTPDDTKHWPEAPAFLVATSAGEVGVDLDADHMVCDLVEWERMVQRLGRVNRRGGERRVASVEIVAAPPRSESKDGEKWPDRLERLRKPIDALNGDGSPAAIVALKEDKGQADALAKAQTPVPLRPPLTRALVDAWSMTSLEEHTGRPDIQPWLRGWEKDDEPQATLVWRRWLPWRECNEKPIEKDVEEFFATARIHLEEMLEAPTYRVLNWLSARARKALDEAKKAKAAGEPPPLLTEKSPALIVLDRRGKLEQALRLEELADFGQLKSNDRKRAESDLTGRTLVVSSALGGLTGDGMLDDGRAEPPSALDNGWDEDILRERIGYRIVGPHDEPEPTKWKVSTSILLSPPEKSEEVKALCVYVARGGEAARAGNPAIARTRQGLNEHQEMVADAVREMAGSLGLTEDYQKMLEWVARYHDLGKDRDLWQNAMAPREPREGRPWAKTTGHGDGRRLNRYRHEFGSLRDVEINEEAKRSLDGLDADLHDLALHLVASHHGRARPVISAYDPLCHNEFESTEQTRARAQEAALRFARLQRRWGPWGLAWWEAVFRAADRQASRRHDEEGV